MLLTHSRIGVRTDVVGDLVTLAAQDRSRWNRVLITEGVGLVERALVRGPVGPFQLQAAIAAVHAEAQTWGETDWAQILVLYRMLESVNPGAVVSLNLAVALAMAESPGRGLEITRTVLADPGQQRSHRTFAVHAHLLSMVDAHHDAACFFSRAATLATSAPEQRYLLRMATVHEQRASE